MPLRLDGKKVIVSDVAAMAKRAVSVLAAEYNGLTVSQITELRARARESDVFVRVVRNNLAKRAFAETEFSCLDKALTGPIMLAFSLDELGAAARIFKDFSKKWDNLQVKAISLDGCLYGASDLNRVASLPTRNEAISQLMSVMQAPIAKLVRTLSAPQEKLVRTFVAIKELKEKNQE